MTVEEFEKATEEDLRKRAAQTNCLRRPAKLGN
jgi:hypothetical protein